MKTALFGGSFNPIHLGHLLLAKNAIQSLGLDRLFFVPCSIPPHKQSEGLIPGHHRLAMARRAIQGDPKLSVLSLEIERGGVSYTVDTVSHLHWRYPKDQLFFVLGSDNFQEIGKWNRFSDLIRICEFLVIERPGSKIQLPPSDVPKNLLSHLRYQVIEGPTMEVSSSQIRQMVRNKKDVTNLIPSSVYEYIQEYSLYQK